MENATLLEGRKKWRLGGGGGEGGWGGGEGGGGEGSRITLQEERGGER